MPKKGRANHCGVAQSVERRSVKPVVGGSSPSPAASFCAGHAWPATCTCNCGGCSSIRVVHCKKSITTESVPELANGPVSKTGVDVDNAGSSPAALAEPNDFDDDIKNKARAIMLKTKGYGDRPARKANVDRLLWRNFGQESAPKNPKAYAEGHERTFGEKRPPLNPGKRDGYTVRGYRASMAYEIDMDLPQNRPEPEDFD